MVGAILNAYHGMCRCGLDFIQVTNFEAASVV